MFARVCLDHEIMSRNEQEMIKFLKKCNSFLINVPIEGPHFEICHEFLFIVEQLEFVQEILHGKEGSKNLTRSYFSILCLP